MYTRFFTIIGVFFILFSLMAGKAHASSLTCLTNESTSSFVHLCTAVTSAQIKDTIERPEIDTREIRLKSYLESMKSPLAPHTGILIKAADEYELPWQLIPAISGVESTFCKRIPYQSQNCWGWNNGTTSFPDYETAIFTVAKTLRKRYFDRGYTTPALISPIYAPPSKTWAKNVEFFIDKINTWEISEKMALQMDL